MLTLITATPDPVGATWGPGVRRAPTTGFIWGFNKATAAKINMPMLLVSGIHDKQIVPARVRRLYEDASANDKVFIDMGCSSHMVMWERHHRLLFEASRQWLLNGAVNGTKKGMLRLGYEPDLPALAPAQ